MAEEMRLRWTGVWWSRGDEVKVKAGTLGTVEGSVMYLVTGSDCMLPLLYYITDHHCISTSVLLDEA